MGLVSGAPIPSVRAPLMLGVIIMFVAGLLDLARGSLRNLNHKLG